MADFDLPVFRQSGDQRPDCLTIDQTDQVAFIKYVENPDRHPLITA
jgi:hypothetical protein